MTNPVDLTNLREMTDGDVEMEKELFDEFFSSSEECISIMENNCTDGENEVWRSKAHALKGTAVNLGAAKLGEFFKEAQENHAAPAQEKKDILTKIKDEYGLVREFISNVH